MSLLGTPPPAAAAAAVGAALKRSATAGSAAASLGSIAAATAHNPLPPNRRENNRIILLCASINDVTSWPFWKFLQLKKIKGVTDLRMLAFNSEGGSFLGKIDGTDYSVKNYENVKRYYQPMLEEFLERNHAEGRTYFVYGGHGMGDYLELEEHTVALQVHELAKIFNKKRYEAILFDACFMSSLDCVYHLRNHTRWIGACEGYMWEEDVALDQHIFNTFTASAMSRFRDPKVILETIQRDYTNKSRRGDFSVLCTDHVEALHQYVEKRVWQRVYDRASFYNVEQHEELQALAENTLLSLDELEGTATATTTAGANSSAGPTSQPSAIFTSSTTSKKKILLRAVQFEHSLYPSELEDKHLVDLKQYLVDIALEDLGSLPGRSKTECVRSHGGDDMVVTETRGTEEGVAERKDALGATQQNTNTPNCEGGDEKPNPGVSESNDKKDDEDDLLAARLENHEGLQLLRRVVVSHVPPFNKRVYACPLGGLSLAVHQFSHLSKPLKRCVPQDVDKTLFLEKANAFLQSNGQKCSPPPRRGSRQPQPAAAAAAENATPPVTTTTEDATPCHGSSAIEQ